MLQPFTEETIAWFMGIRADNSKDYFTQHKRQYEDAVRTPFMALLEALASEFGGAPFVFRPNRDVRFTPDKSPYKSNVSGYLKGRPDSAAACYIEVSIDGVFAATGYHEMAADQLARYREALQSEDAASIATKLRHAMQQAEGYTVGGEQLKTAPRGIDRNAKNIDLLRYKSLTVSARMPLEPGQAAQKTLDFVRDAWNAGSPLSTWLDAHVGASALPDSKP